MNQPKSPITFEQLPDSAYIRLRQLVGAVLPFSSATLWRKCRRGEFPPPVRMSAGVTAWQVGQVRVWLKDPIKYQVPQHAAKAVRRL
jgi:prophage regulatory protein